jgi:hypothetical protein
MVSAGGSSRQVTMMACWRASAEGTCRMTWLPSSGRRSSKSTWAAKIVVMRRPMPWQSSGTRWVGGAHPDKEVCDPPSQHAMHEQQHKEVLEVEQTWHPGAGASVHALEPVWLVLQSSWREPDWHIQPDQEAGAQDILERPPRVRRLGDEPTVAQPRQ